MSRVADLSVIVHSGGFDRVHFAFAMVAAAAASGRQVVMFLTGGSLPVVMAGDGWLRLGPADDGSSPAERERYFASVGVATLQELVAVTPALGVRLVACEMGLRVAGIDFAQADPLLSVELAGIVTLLEASGGQVVCI